MLTYSLVAAIHFSPIQENRTAPNPKATSSKSVSGKLATTGLIRMTSPETLPRMVKAGGSSEKLLRPFEKGRAASRTFIQTPSFKQREFKLPPRGKVDESLKKAPEVIPLFYTGSTTMYSGYWGIFPKEEYNFDAAYGDIVQGTDAPTGHYNGVAPRDGKVTVSKPKGGPFIAYNVITYTGYWNGSEPQIDKVMSSPSGVLSVAVKAGQEYRVNYKFDSKALKPGSYKATSDIDDGNIIHMSLSGSVVAPFGGITASVGSYPTVVPTGQSIKVPITFAVDGNTPSTSVKMEILNANTLKSAGIVAVGGEIKVSNGSPATTNLMVYGSDAPDSQQVIQVKFSGYNGNASAVFNVPVSLKTVWITSGPFLTQAGNVNLWAQMKLNSLGYYECTTNVATTSTFLGDGANWIIYANNEVNGKRYAIIGMRYIHAKYEIGKSSYDDADSGYSSLVRANFSKLFGSGFSSVLQVNQSLADFNAAQDTWKVVSVSSGLPFD